MGNQILNPSSSDTQAKQEKELLDDLLTNSNNDFSLSSGNRNSSTEDILNRFALDSDIMDFSQTQTDSSYNAVPNQSRKRAREENNTNTHVFNSSNSKDRTNTNCIHCRRSFPSQIDLNRHKCSLNSGPNSGVEKKDVIHACNLCSYATKRLPDLVRHMRLKHTDE